MKNCNNSQNREDNVVKTLSVVNGKGWLHPQGDLSQPKIMFKVEPWNNIRWKVGEIHHSLNKHLLFLAIKVVETIWLDLTHRQTILDERNLCGTWEIILLSCGYCTCIKRDIECILTSKICCKIWFMVTVYDPWVKGSIGIVQYISLRAKSANSINSCYHLIVNTQALHVVSHL